jgi:hypothetical protein
MLQSVEVRRFLFPSSFIISLPPCSYSLTLLSVLSAFATRLSRVDVKDKIGSEEINRCSGVSGQQIGLNGMIPRSLLTFWVEQRYGEVAWLIRRGNFGSERGALCISRLSVS